MKFHFNFIIIFISLIYSSCNSNAGENKGQMVQQWKDTNTRKTSLVVLGTVQDAGSPHIACTKACCKDLFQNPDQSRKATSLGIIDHQSKKTWLFEATPDIATQMKALKFLSGFKAAETPDGIFLTHAHIGHYAGLMYLGREAMNAAKVPVYAMPRMKSFLETNGPWNQLVKLQNIELLPVQREGRLQLSTTISIVPFVVPHRDEYSETVGYTIEGPNKKVLFIPDIDKWEKWNKNIIEEIKGVDYAFIDATFYDGAEVPNRDISEIPHPFVIESMAIFKNLPVYEKKKIYFIHFNHTNPLLNKDSKESKTVIDNGFNIAQMGQIIEL